MKVKITGDAIWYDKRYKAGDIVDLDGRELETLMLAGRVKFLPRNDQEKASPKEVTPVPDLHKALRELPNEFDVAQEFDHDKLPCAEEKEEISKHKLYYDEMPCVEPPSMEYFDDYDEEESSGTNPSGGYDDYNGTY